MSEKLPMIPEKHALSVQDKEYFRRKAQTSIRGKSSAQLEEEDNYLTSPASMSDDELNDRQNALEQAREEEYLKRVS